MFKRAIQSKLVKVLSLNSISMMVGFLTGIISTKYISMFLGPAGMALLGSFRNFVTMNKSVATMGANNSLIALYVENKNNKKELSVLYSTFFWVFMPFSVLVGGITFFAARYFSVGLFFNAEFETLIRFLGILMPFIVLNVFWLAMYNAMERFQKLVLIQIVSGILIFGLTLFLVKRRLIIQGLYSVVWGELILFLVTLCYVLKDKKSFQFSLYKTLNKRYLKKIVGFSGMALVSAVLVPLTLLFIRYYIVQTHSIIEAGMWDATNKISSFYMAIFSSGLTLYYMPKLAALSTNQEFKAELKFYFMVFVPAFFLALVVVYFLKDVLIGIVFTNDFRQIKSPLIWQLMGDFFRILSLAFGYQIVVKSKLKDYFLIEFVFNGSYLIGAILLVKKGSFEGALQAYFYASVITFLLMLFLFRKLFTKD